MPSYYDKPENILSFLFPFGTETHLEKFFEIIFTALYFRLVTAAMQETKRKLLQATNQNNV